MRRLRSLAAALAGLLLIQVSLLGAGLACAASASVNQTLTGDERAAHHEGSHGGHGRMAAESTLPAAPERQTPASHHDGPLHCPGTTSCASATIGSAEVRFAGLEVSDAAEPSAHAVKVPMSVAGAPEPPPPRA